ncbi:hypothetical protein AYI70_g8788, partial [Smittium culicis]
MKFPTRPNTSVECGKGAQP